MIVKKMPRNVKKKLAIFAGTSRCLVYAEAKYCVSEMPGEAKYYECSRTEYCCAFGCCVSPGLHFHHLWYYWILVIIMFLVCSGGGWWYRYWLQGRYRAAASAIPSRSSSSRAQNPLRGPTCQAQQARITYNSARNTVLLYRMWKGPQRNGAPTAYNGNATTSGQYQNMNVVLNDANCPYYQLYGPPPSYETVIAQSRGKVSSPASPETTTARLNIQPPNVIPNPSVSQCFAYPCSPTRLNASIDQNGAMNGRQVEPHREASSPYVHFPPYCATNGSNGSVPPVRQNLCVPFEYQEQPVVPVDGFNRAYRTSPNRYTAYTVDKSSDTSDTENVGQSYEMPSTGRYLRLNADCSTSSTRDQSSWELIDRSRVLANTDIYSDARRIVENRAHRQDETAGEVADGEAGTSDSRSESSIESDSRMVASPISMAPPAYRFSRLERTEQDVGEFRRICGGSLKLPGRYNEADRCKRIATGDQGRAFLKATARMCQEVSSSFATDVEASKASDAVDSLERIADISTSPSQSNPSNNVILASFVYDDASSHDADDDDDEDRRVRAAIAARSTNSNHESKHRLDRSRSLD